MPPAEARVEAPEILNEPACMDPPILIDGVVIPPSEDMVIPFPTTILSLSPSIVTVPVPKVAVPVTDIFPPTFRFPPVVVIPPAEARVVIPTDLNVEFAVNPLRISTAAFISTLDVNVDNPATDISPPILTALPIPIPPSITKAPFVVQ